MFRKIIILTAIFCIALIAQAQILRPVKWDIQLIDSDTAEKEIHFTATSDAGWHVYDMNLPPGGPISTSFTFETKQGVELIGNPFSSVEPLTVHDETFNMELRWYSGTVVFTQKINVTDPRRFRIAGEVEFMACNDETCLPPDRFPFAFDRRHISAATSEASTDEPDDADEPTDELPESDETNDSQSQQPIPFIWQRENTTDQQENVLTDSSDLWDPVIEEMKAFGDTTVSAKDSSWLYIFFAGFIGGLIALLTPCVWPMIPMTVSFFLKRNKDRKKPSLMHLYTDFLSL